MKCWKLKPHAPLLGIKDVKMKSGLQQLYAYDKSKENAAAVALHFIGRRRESNCEGFLREFDVACPLL